MQKNKIVIIAGTTASGKSALSLDIAKEFDSVIINADSMQIYKDTPILSACPSPEDKKVAPHFLYEIYDAEYESSIADWLKLATTEIQNAWRNKKLPILVGGTGMYINAIINGMSKIPNTPDEIKEKVSTLIKKVGINEVYKILSEKAPIAKEKLSENDTTRVRRAYEVLLDTGKSIFTWQEEGNVKPLPEAEFIVIKIIPSVEETNERCYQRFDLMIEQGAIEEAIRLHKKNLNPDSPAMKAIGVKEFIQYINQEISLDEAIELSKIHTRQYAKKQRTWFNNQINADITIKTLYKNDKNILQNIKKLLHKGS